MLQLVHTTVAGAAPSALSEPAIDSSSHFTPSVILPCLTSKVPTSLAAQNSRSRSPAARASSCAWQAHPSPATGSSVSNALMTSSQPRSDSSWNSSTSRAKRATQPAEAAVLPI